MCSACVTLCECEKISEQGGKGGGGGGGGGRRRCIVLSIQLDFIKRCLNTRFCTDNH